MNTEIKEKVKSMSDSERRIEHKNIVLDIAFRKGELFAMESCLESIEIASNKLEYHNREIELIRKQMKSLVKQAKDFCK